MAENSPPMAIFAKWAMPAETTVIPWAVFDFAFRVNVPKWTFTVAAGH
jgi:hypothetical protein